MAQKTIGRLQKGDPGSLEFAVYGFSGGLNVKSVPQEVGDNDLTVALNGYLTTSGGFRMRNSMVLRDSLAAGPVLGLARFFQGVKNGAAVSPPTTLLLAQVGSTLYNADTQGVLGSIGIPAMAAQPMTYVRCQDPNDSNVGYSGGVNDVIVICTGSGGPYIFDGTNIYAPAGWSAAANAQWCALVNGVVWFGGIKNNPRTIYGTGDGVIVSFETLPATNTFLVSQPVTGLCALGTGAIASLVVGMNNGVAVLYGTGLANYVLQDVPSFSDGVIAGRSMVFEAGTCYWLGRQAVYAFDGQGPPRQLSRKVEPWVLNDPAVPGYPISSNQNLAFSFIYNNRFHLGYVSGAGNSVPNTLLVYDLVVNGWTVLQTTPGIYCACPLDAPSDAVPMQLVAGSSTNGNVYNWDIEPASGGIATDDGQPIIVQMQTKYFKLGVPGTTKSLMRLYPEMYIAGGLIGNFIVSTDYGTQANNKLIAQNAVTGAQWDVSQWDNALWGSGLVFQPYTAPLSRIDLAQVQGESFAFGVTTVGNCSPWIIGGLTGVYAQRGRG